MSGITQAEQFLLDQIRRGQEQAWSQLIERYQGRLLAFAKSRLPQQADAEDIVQETFLAFLKGWRNFRGQASLETFLFTILRRKIINCYRGRKSNEVCLLQDVYRQTEEGHNHADPLLKIPGPDPTASWYIRRDESHEQQRQALAVTMRRLLDGYKKSLNFRDLKIIELIFYCHLSNHDVAEIIGLSEGNVAVIKHRCIQQVRRGVARFELKAEKDFHFENMLSEVWETNRLSCLKRSTIGAFLLGSLDKDWHDYVDFHLHRLGCHFCRANLADLRQQTTEKESHAMKKRILESTIGFLTRP